MIVSIEALTLQRHEERAWKDRSAIRGDTGEYERPVFCRRRQTEGLPDPRPRPPGTPASAHRLPGRPAPSLLTAQLSLLTSHRFLNDLSFVEVNLLGAEYLVGLVTLAREQNRVARPSLVQGRVTGR